jgi:hypothetical protein
MLGDLGNLSPVFDEVVGDVKNANTWVVSEP